MNAGFATFYGTFSPRLDEKGRLTLPARFRSFFEDGVVLTRGQEHCVYGWTPTDHQAFAQKARQMPFTHAESRNFVRMFFSGMTQEVPDKQGRVSIPPQLRAWASLDRECTVVGAMDRIEIWDSARWAEFEASQEEAFAGMSEGAMPGMD